MSYVIPSVLVYQQLANAGGVANISPDLRACIIGPCYNVLDYDGTSAVSLALTRATDEAGSPAEIVNNNINNTFNLPNQKPGQNLDESSLSVYVNNAMVNTISSMFAAQVGSNELEVVLSSGEGDATTSSPNLTNVTNINTFFVGDEVTVTGIGVAGANVVAKILDVDIDTAELTIDFTSVATVTGVSITKNPIINLNTVSATLKIEAGDTAVITYGPVEAPKTFSSTVSEIVEVDGIVVQLNLSDIMPEDLTDAQVAVQILKLYNNQLLASSNYDESTTGATGQITVLPKPKLPYGTIVTADVHVQYRALRTDLIGAIQTIADPNDIEGTLGFINDRNPLALGVQLAMANTTGEISAVAIDSEDLQGYLQGLDMVENSRIYAIVPLTTSIDVITALQQHVDQLSTPEEASWRIGLVSTDIPTTKNIGPWNKDLVNVNGGNNTITLVGEEYILTAGNATFLSDGVVPGDVIYITDGAGTPSPVGTHMVKNVMSNQQLIIEATGAATGVAYYIERTLTKAQQAEHVAGISTTLGDKRMIHCPNTAGVVINGVTKYLPGYYFMCGLAGLISGLPPQQGLTNIALAGFVDVRNSNFWFTRAQMRSMGAAGTLLIGQETQGSLPYILHELTTDMSVLEYREIQTVKTWDWNSYAYYDALKSFIGRWNITPDTIANVRQTIDARSLLTMGQKMPKIGAPLLDYNIIRLEQDSANKDSLIAEVAIKIPYVLNYIHLYLII